MTMKLAMSAAACLLVLATPAFAQFSGGGGGKESSGVQKAYEQRLKEQAEIDKQYKESMRRTGGEAPKPQNDPWANIRPAEPAKPSRSAR